MTAYILRRIFRLITVLLGVTIVVFGFVRLLPGDPAQVMLGERATTERVEALKERLGLNKPIFFNAQNPTDTQFSHFLTELVKGNLGEGIQSQIPVKDDVQRRFPATVELSIGAMVFALLIGLPAGIVAALNRNKPLDNLAMTVSLVGVSMPIFWLGMLLVLLFSVTLGWLPPSSRLDSNINLEPITGLNTLDSLLQGNMAAFFNSLKHLILPSIALGTIPMAIIARITRASMLEVLSQDYVRTATAKGLNHRTVILKHALRNATLPVVTIIGLQVGVLLGGAILTETIFSWPGIGSWLYQGIFERDYPVIQGGIVFAALVISVVNLLVDISYAYLDPRIQYS